MDRERRTVPVPRQSGQGSVMTLPVPSQSGQGAENAKAPRFSVTYPVPLQFLQALVAPVRDPEPWQAAQGASPVSWTGSVVPLAASRKSSVISVSTSDPRVGRADRRVAPQEPPKMSLKPPVERPPPKISEKS